MPSRTPLKRGQSRVWLFENGAGPETVPQYVSDMIAQAPGANFGGVTRIENPDPNAYDRFKSVGEVRSAVERPTLPLMGRYSLKTLSDLLRIGKSGCMLDVQIHMGDCQNPADFNSGWTKILALRRALIETWGTDGDVGTLDSGGNAPVNEVSSLSADEMDEIVRMLYTRLAASSMAGEIVDITVCAPGVCIDCAGCQDIFAISISSGVSPTGTNDIVYSTDGGTTWAARPLGIWGAAVEPTNIACVGDYLLIGSLYALEVAYMRRSEFIANTGTWTRFTFVAGQTPEWIFAYSPSQIWIAQDGGAISIMRTPTLAPVASLGAGVLTTQTLNHIHAFDEDNIVAVGNANVVVASSDGGETWRLITGPVAGVVLNRVAMRSPTEWFVGTAQGLLHYTLDSGVTWSRSDFPFNGTGNTVTALNFAPDLNMVGWLATRLADLTGRILRTIDGGRSWYVAPEAGSMPAHSRINNFAVCSPNKVFGGGLHSDATDGSIILGSAA